MSDTNTRIDDLTQDIKEIEKHVTSRVDEGNGADIDYEKLAGLISDKAAERQRLAAEEAKTKEDYLEQMVEARVKEVLETQAPQRRRFGPDAEGIIQGRRDSAPASEYEAMLQSGYQPKHLIMAHNFMMDMVKGGHRAARKPSQALMDIHCKLMTSTGTGAGDELVPTGLQNTLWQDFFLESVIVQNMRARGQVIDPMPTDPFNVPTMGEATWSGTPGQGQASAAQDLTTAAPVLTTKLLRAVVEWSYELDEDAVIAMMPSVGQELARSGAYTWDAFAINADATSASTGNINLDDDTPASDAYYLSSGQDGIRHQYIVDNTGQHTDAGGDALTDTDMLGALADMGKYGVRPEQTVIIVSPQVYIKMFDLGNIATMDKVGDRAAYVTGMVNDYMRIPVIISSAQPLAEADGKVCKTAASNTLGTISIFNLSQWYTGFKRSLMIESARDIEKQKTVMVASFRMAIACRGTRSAATHTAGIRNILV